MNTCAGSTRGSRQPRKHPIRLSSDCEDPKKKNTQKPISFIAPGQLAKNREFGKKTSNVEHGIYRARINELKTTNDFCSHATTTGGHLVQKLVLHYGDSELQEEATEDEISYLDLSRMSKKLLNIDSTGFTFTDAFGMPAFSFTDGVGRPLRNDNDVLALMKEHVDVEYIHVHLFVSKSFQTSFFQLPEDNTSSVSVPRQSQEKDVTMEENTVEDADPYQAASQKKKRKQGQRGIAKCLKLNAERMKLGGDKVGLTWDPRPKVPKTVAKHASWLVSAIGKVTRRRVSPGIEFWKDVDGQVKLQIWAEIEDNFAPVNREEVLTEASKRFSSWKNKMYEQVTKYMEKGGVWPPPILNGNVSSQEDWDAYLKLIKSPSFEKRSDINKKNRAKNTTLGHHGQLSLAAHRWKRTNPVEDPLGDDPIEIWAAKHKNSEGQFDNARVADAYRRLVEVKERIAPGRRATHEEDEKIFVEVFGPRRGYIVGLGPTKPIRSSASQCEGSSSAQIWDIQLDKMEKMEKSQNKLKEENKLLKNWMKGCFATLKRLDASLEMPEMPEFLHDEDSDNEADDVDMDDY